MSITELIAMVQPPANPCEVGSSLQWAAIEEELGTKLPTDYREFVFTYGSGHFAHFYRVNNPFASSEYTALVPATRRWSGILRELQERIGEDYVPFPIFPESNGLLHWANDDNGNCYYWHTKGSPDQWTVVQDEVRGSGFREHNCSMTRFLINVLTQKIKPLASGFPRQQDFAFEPWDTSATG